MILTQKQQKYQHYLLKKFININILRWRNIAFKQRKITEQAKFAYYPLGKALEKQTEKWSI